MPKPSKSLPIPKDSDGLFLQPADGLPSPERLFRAGDSGFLARRHDNGRTWLGRCGHDARGVAQFTEGTLFNEQQGTG